MRLEGKKVLVVGLGKTGLAAARFATGRGAQVTVNDVREEGELGNTVEKARALDASIELGAHPIQTFVGADLIVVSPGVPDIEPLHRASVGGVPIVSEVELASWYLEAPVIAVTGTNGKSTVTSLIGEMCAAERRDVFVGGNLGTPLIDAVDTSAGGPNGLVVAELSSFQLERIDRFCPHVAVLLNITPDHLDRYDSFKDYVQAKARIFARQTPRDFAVVPDRQHVLSALASASGAKLEAFGTPDGSVRVEDERIVDHVSGMSVAVAELGIQGKHNLENACAAALAARLAGIGADAVKAGLISFTGLPHRMQLVREVEGVGYVDDSKATNVGAAVASVEGLSPSDGKIVLIAGGKHKGSSYAPLVARMARHGRGAVVIGEAANLLSREFSAARLDVKRASSMDEAVEMASSLAEPGDTVLLAPACSSYDMYASFEERGKAFQRAVSRIARGI